MAGKSRSVGLWWRDRAAWRLLAASGVAACLVIAGCQARVAQRVREPEGGRQGGAWEAVVASAFVNQRLAGQDPRSAPEFARADARLSTADGPILATREWPEPARASLDRPRRIYLPTRAENLLYFEQERGVRSSTSGPNTRDYRWWW